MDNLVHVFITDASGEIEEAMKSNLFEHMGTMVTDQSRKFNRELQGNASNILDCNFSSL